MKLDQLNRLKLNDVNFTNVNPVHAIENHLIGPTKGTAAVPIGMMTTEATSTELMATTIVIKNNVAVPTECLVTEVVPMELLATDMVDVMAE